MSLDALIVDVDGTIAETEEAHRAAFNAAFREFGEAWEWDRALYGELLKVAGGRERIRHYLERFHPERLKDPNIDTHVRALHARKTELYSDEAARLPLRPGITRLFSEALKAGARLAIATTTSRANVDALLGRTPDEPALDWFNVVATGEWVEHKKPHPEVFDKTLERLGTRPERCLALEDSANGLEAAKAAGVPTLVTVNPYTEHETFRGAVAVLSHLGDPDTPMQVHQGASHGRHLVDLDLLRQWMGQATS